MAEKLTHVRRTDNVFKIELPDSVRRRAAEGRSKNHAIQMDRRSLRVLAGAGSAALLFVAAGMYMNQRAEAEVAQYLHERSAE